MIPLAENTIGSEQHEMRQPPEPRPISQASSASSLERHDNINIKSEPLDFSSDHEVSTKSEKLTESDMHQLFQQQVQAAQLREQQQQREREQQSLQNMFYNNYETKSESGSSEHMSRPQSPSGSYGVINDLLNSHSMDSMSSMNNMGPPKKFKIFDKSYETGLQLGSQHSPTATTTSSSGKRANRTRFTDYQIKVLQEFFENNSYPKDSDLEYLSKLLLLSPRVIVVWFQVSKYYKIHVFKYLMTNFRMKSIQNLSIFAIILRLKYNLF